MRSIWTIGVTLAAMILLIGVMPTTRLNVARAQDEMEAGAETARLRTQTVLRTYDINDLVASIPNYSSPPMLAPVALSDEDIAKGAFEGSFAASDGIPRADRIQALMDLIKNAISRGAWVPVGLTNTMDEIDGVLYATATDKDHQAIAKLLAEMRSYRSRAIAVQWLVFEISTAQLHDLKQRFADGGLLVSARNAKTLLDELETGKLKNTPVASARWVCMNRQRTWIMPLEKQSIPTDKDEEGETIFGEVCHAGTFDIESVLTGDNTSILCTTAVSIAAGPADEKADASDLRQYQFQSTVVIPNGGGVLMTAANHKTAQQGREVVLFLQAASVSPGAGADARR
ncbi:MAG: hypothetical protein ACYC26_07905 [Phycisphaerales bacterium]